MNTIAKLMLPCALLICMSAGAQEKKSKVCIKIDENKNGTITKIDTCYESADPKEIDAFLKRMGAEDDLNTTVNVSFDDKNKTKQIIIVQDGEKDGKNESYNYNYTTSDKPDGDVTLIINDGDKESENTRVIVKRASNDDKELDEKLKKMIDEEKTETKGQKGTKKEIRIIISRKVEINNITDEDKKAMPTNLQQLKGDTFEGLNLYPNPGKDHVMINYKGNTSEPLTIRLFDLQGKTIAVEKEVNTNKEITKKIDLTALNKGTYFLSLEQGKKSEVRKIVVSE